MAIFLVNGDPSVVGCIGVSGDRSIDILTDIVYCRTGPLVTDWSLATAVFQVESAGGGGPHTHDQSDIDDLTVDLAGKAASVHAHAQGDVTGLVSSLAGKADTAHGHAQSDVAGLVSALAGKSDTGHTHAQSAVTNLVSDLAGKAASVHSHPQSEVTNLVTDLAGKAASVHSHAQADVTNLVTDLAGKAALSHAHNASDINAGTVATARLGSGTADGTTFLRGDQTWATPAGGGGASGKDDQYYRQVGTSPLERYYIAGMGNGIALTTGAPTVNVLRAFPFFSTRGGTLDRIAIQVTTLIASGVARLGIYQATSDTNLYPSARIVDAGTVSTATTGMKTITINVPLTANTLYWLVHLAGPGAATLRCMAMAGCAAIFGASNVLATAAGVGISVAFTAAPIPATFPAGGAVITAVPIPAIGVRFFA